MSTIEHFLMKGSWKLLKPSQFSCLSRIAHFGKFVNLHISSNNLPRHYEFKTLKSHFSNLRTLENDIFGNGFNMRDKTKARVIQRI